MELTKSGVGVGVGVGGIALEFPSAYSSSPEKIPRRIRRRLMDSNKTPCVTSLDEIEAKLKEANLRRQQFHDWLSNKARRKSRSPSWSSSQDEDLGQRLEAKLHAAEQNRLNIIAKAQRRLARMNEVRQAAKSEVEMRFESRREELGTKVESRVQKAEVNRMLLLKAHRQRKAAAKERTAQSLLQRMVRERKYKDCVSAAISQKRAAAERKRLRLLEAEKTRVHAKVMQVRTVAKSVYYQREVERRKMKDQLENRLQKAKRQRAEYLRQRGNRHTVRVKMQQEGEILSRKLARCWRQFLKSRKTTFALAKEFEALEINEKSVSSMQFEQFALRIESPGTLQTVKALLDRLEKRLTLSRTTISSSSPSYLDNIDHLLKRLASPKRRSTPSNVTRSRGSRKVASSEGGQSPTKLSRYHVRVTLCAYMILGHPDAVLNGQGEHEKLLAQSATNFIREFELLINIILDGPIQNTFLESAPALPGRTFRKQLESFDTAWCSYLKRFVAWKGKDARALEEDLVRAACQMELSMMQTCKLSVEGEDNLTHDMKAVQKQVTEDQKLLRAKVLRLSGDAGVKRMECALSDTRSRYFEAKENSSTVILPIAHISSPDLPIFTTSPSSVSTSAETSFSVKSDGEKSRSVVRSLFSNAASSWSEGFDSSSSNSGGRQLSSLGENLLSDNELLVNEIIHEHHHTVSESSDVSHEDQNDIKANIKETMERAFWDTIAESLKQNEPEYGRIVELFKEVRDELCEMSPQSWKQNIFDSIDLDILSQVLMSGTSDLGYLGNILEFALVTLQKLSAPANEKDMIKNHKKLMDELSEISQAEEASNSSFVVAVIRGLRFVLEQTQILKREINKARIRILEPVIRGPAGFEYLRKAFEDRFGSPLNASNSLPLTVGWLLSVRSSVDQEWDEHSDSLSSLTLNATSTLGLPHTSLRTGGSNTVASSRGELVYGAPFALPTATGHYQPECRGDRIDKMVRLGLLKLTSEIEGITKATLPETLQLNLSRLRNVQAQLQKIIVTATSLLVLRQTLVSEKLATSSVDIEEAVLNCVGRVGEILDTVEDVGIKEIVEAMYESYGDDSGKLKSKKSVMESMLAKSLRAEDPVFGSVSRAVHLASRGVVLGGSGLQGKELAEGALRRVGAAVLTDKLMKTVEILIVVATVSNNVHGPWYSKLV